LLKCPLIKLPAKDLTSAHELKNIPSPSGSRVSLREEREGRNLELKDIWTDLCWKGEETTLEVT